MDTMEQYAIESGTFTVRIIPSDDMYNLNEEDELEVHETVLRPILKECSEAWVYGTSKSSDLYERASPILTKSRGKYAISLDIDPIKGYEYLWNSSGGKRGSIVLLLSRERFKNLNIFGNCESAWVFGNFRTGHTPSAVNFARKIVKYGNAIAVCLPRNNGIEWMDIYASHETIGEIYSWVHSQVKNEYPT